MNWLIVEDALRDRKGHWCEYLGTFARELRALGDGVTILADRAAEPFLIEQLQVQPVLPPSIWHRMGDGAGVVRRSLRVPVHAWQTYRALKKYLRAGDPFDVIFVPTVLVHHLLGWTWLIKRAWKKRPGRVILFFPNTPVQLNLQNNEPAWQPAPTARLFCRLIRALREEVGNGRVILGAETEPMRAALTALTGVPFTYFPHPVVPSPAGAANAGRPPGDALTMASYGGARHEKGCDVLVAAVGEYCRRHPESRTRFILQNVEGDRQLWDPLNAQARVRLISHYFADGEYARRLCETDVMLLPYRRSSYGLRVSRVVIEAMVRGICVVTTRGTTLAQQADEFGTGTFCQDEDAESLVAAIETAERNFAALAAIGRQRQAGAQEHFSVAHFRDLLLAGAAKPDRN
jgi:glycosyltransferase involved in cell wall biosynthesis